MDTIYCRRQSKVDIFVLFRSSALFKILRFIDNMIIRPHSPKFLRQVWPKVAEKYSQQKDSLETAQKIMITAAFE
uniref:Uncharacterized protein n=1 Tax=Romanomermis culicivorax TaxID=13658 RepID=A0A915JHJ1_ROMCU